MGIPVGYLAKANYRGLWLWISVGSFTEDPSGPTPWLIECAIPTSSIRWHSPRIIYAIDAIDAHSALQVFTPVTNSRSQRSLHTWIPAVEEMPSSSKVIMRDGIGAMKPCFTPLLSSEGIISWSDLHASPVARRPKLLAGGLLGWGGCSCSCWGGELSHSPWHSPIVIPPWAFQNLTPPLLWHWDPNIFSTDAWHHPATFKKRHNFILFHSGPTLLQTDICRLSDHVKLSLVTSHQDSHYSDDNQQFKWLKVLLCSGLGQL